MGITRKCKKCGKHTSGKINPCDFCDPNVKVELIEKGDDYTVYKIVD